MSRRMHLLPLVVRAAPLALALGAGCAHVPEQKYDFVVPPPPEQPRFRLEFIYKDSETYGKRTPWLDALLGRASGGEKQALSQPVDVVSDGEGRVYVTDMNDPPRVAVFDDRKQETRWFGATGQGRLEVPVGLALDRDGQIYVADAKLRRVHVFAPDGKFKAAFGTDDTLERPVDVAVDRERGVLYVADIKSHRVQVFSLTDGRLVRTIGRRGIENGEFNFPGSLALDRNGRLHVSDQMNFRYQVFDADGRFVLKQGTPGNVPGTFSRPKGIAVDRDGRVYVTDAAFGNVQVFDDQGRLLLWIGSGGGEPGQFLLPQGVYVDAADAVFVVDPGNRRLQRLRFLRQTPAAADDARPAEVRQVTTAPGG